MIDDLEDLDVALNDGDLGLAADLKDDVCDKADKIIAFNKRAKIGAGLPHVGNLSEDDPAFDEINDDTDEIRDVIGC